MIRFSDIDGNPVMSTSSAVTVGKIDRPLLDPGTQRVVGFSVKKSKGPGNTLTWEHITGIGPDAVTVESEERVTDPPEQLTALSSLKFDVIGHRVLTDQGRDLGKVRDVEFDPADGRVVSIVVKDEFVDGERLLGIGSYAVVVKA